MRNIIGVLGCLFTLAGCSIAPAGAAETPPNGGYIAQAVDADEVTATGRIVALNRAAITPRVGGRIIRLGTDEAGKPLDIGMEVREGQVLFAVDPAPYQLRMDAAEAALGSARATLSDLTSPVRKERIAILQSAVAEPAARLEHQRREVGRYDRLGEARAASAVQQELARLEETRIKAQLSAAQAQLDEAVAGPTPTAVAVAEGRVREAACALAAARKDLADTETTAPFAGRIVSRAKGVGDTVAAVPGSDVLTLVSNESLEAELELPEAFLNRILPGRTSLILHGAALDGDLPLTVTRIVHDIDPRRGTFTFRIAIPADRSKMLAAGSFVTSTIRLAVEGNAVILPNAALSRDAAGDCVYVLDGESVKRRAVRIGDHLSEGVIVTSGLKAGERVVGGVNVANRRPESASAPSKESM